MRVAVRSKYIHLLLVFKLVNTSIILLILNMSYINFESARVKEAERKAIREAREKVLEKAKKDYERRKEQEIQAKLRGDDKWMLPSVEARIAEDSQSKSKKKKSKRSKSKKKKKKKSKKSSSSSSSSDSDSEEEEWVEKDNHTKESSRNLSNSSDVLTKLDRDEWMSLPGLFPCVSRQEIKDIKKSKEKPEEQKCILDKPGQSERELNPYWKDGGTGLPEEAPKTSSFTHGVGDKGVDWLRRALKRAQEQAEEEGRSIEEVAAERWGSLEKLKSMIREAEEMARGKNSSFTSQRHSSYHQRKSDREHSSSKRGEERKHDRDDRISRRDYEDNYRESPSSSRSKTNMESSHSTRYTHEDTRKGSQSLKSSFQKPSEDSDEEERRNTSKTFRKPRDDDYSSSQCSSGSWRSGSGSGNWRKKGFPEKSAKQEEISEKKKEERTVESSSSSEEEPEDEKKEVKEELLTDAEMNQLAAKLVKAEIMGNQDMIKELKTKLEKAREVRKNLVATGGKKKDEEKTEEKVVVLTRTDSRGFTRPVAPTQERSQGGKRRKEKVETHVDGKRVRYFGDDEKYSLKEMFEREKLNTVEDSNEMFTKLAAKGVGKPESVNDMDDIFEENARFTKSAEKLEILDRNRAISEHKRVDKALENCRWCFDSKLMLKHLIIAIGTKVYLCLPPHQSLTEGHCMIIPMYHSTCGTQLDEDVWNEIQEFRKTLTKMFLEMDQDCVFYETAVHLKNFPHMVLECVPIEKETGDLAPIYFKKAIQECEMEWSNNKKVVDLGSKDVRRAIPKGLPYFCVDFGLQNGFAHVIEDERQWPSNFAQEIIGGMLDLDHHRWRKKRNENFEDQRKKVLQFSKWWKPYDWTQKTRRSKSDSESD